MCSSSVGFNVSDPCNWGRSARTLKLGPGWRRFRTFPCRTESLGPVGILPRGRPRNGGLGSLLAFKISLLASQPPDQQVHVVIRQRFRKRWHTAAFAVSIGGIGGEQHLAQPFG